MKYSLFFTSILFITFGKSFVITSIQTKPEIELVSFEFKSPSNKSEYREFESKLKQNISIDYKKGVTYASFYKKVNECTKIEGNIEVFKDKVTLIIIEKGEICKGVDFKKFIFKIKNPENKKIKFVKR